jgi:ParB-like chromosome segregation protein Spo0J
MMLELVGLKFYKAVKLLLLRLVLRTGGTIVPIVVTHDGLVVDGHTRLREARRRGDETIWAFLVDAPLVEVRIDELKEAY